MINQDKWVDSLPKMNTEFVHSTNQLNHTKWINTIPKKNSYNSVKKYSLMVTLFVSGLLFISAVKNETRNLENEINHLKATVDTIKYNLHQAILDNEVITSPENISLLAKEYLDVGLVSYKKSQIKHLNDESEKFTEVGKIKKSKTNKNTSKNLQVSVKTEVKKRIEKKKTEIRKLQELYHNPKSIPGEIKTQVAIKIKEKKIELKNIYSEPKDIFTLERVGKWSVIQVVKLFFGMPIIPGK